MYVCKQVCQTEKRVVTKYNGLQFTAAFKYNPARVCLCVRVCGLIPHEIKMSPWVLIEGLVGTLFKLS